MKHKEDCKMVFGRKDPTCPRCQELLAGKPARAGWQQAYYAKKTQEERYWTKRAQEMAGIPGHRLNPGGYCIESTCGRCGGDFS